MANISEMPKSLLLLVLTVLAVLITAGLHFSVYRGIAEENRQDEAAIAARRTEVTDLRKYENNLPELNRQIEALRQQLEIQRRIVPDEQEIPQFMNMMQSTAQASGIEIRRWTAGKLVAREYYSEVPFQMELDGPYYSVLNFFERVSKLERIINASKLELSATDGKTGKYQLLPHETVAGTFTSTTFFSRETQGGTPAPAAGAKK